MFCLYCRGVKQTLERQLLSSALVMRAVVFTNDVAVVLRGKKGM